MGAPHGLAYLRQSEVQMQRGGAQPSDVSLETQKAEVQRLVDSAFSGAEITFISEQRPAKLEDYRPAFERLLRLIQTRQYRFVAVHEISRVGRNLRDVQRIIIACKDHHTAFLSCDGMRVLDWESDKHGAVMMEAIIKILGWASELENSMRSLRSSANTNRRMAAGKVPAKLPYGYRRVDGEVVVEPSEAAVVRRVYEMYADGALMKDIAASLGLERTMPRHLLLNPNYRGLVAFPRTQHYQKEDGAKAYGNIPLDELRLVEGETPAVITPQLWRKVSVRLNSTTRKGKQSEQFLLSRIAWCGWCVRPLWCTAVENKGRRYPYYYCPERVDCKMGKAKYYQRDRLERNVVAALTEWLASPEVLRRMHRTQRVAPAETPDHEAVERIERKIAKLVAFLGEADNRATEDIIRVEIKRMEIQRAEIAARNRAIQPVAPRMSERDLERVIRSGRLLEHRDFGCRRQFVRSLVDRVLVYDYVRFDVKI